MRNRFNSFILLLFLFSLTNCSGESGIYNSDAGTDVDGSNNNTCPINRVCGENCCLESQSCILGECTTACEQDLCRGACCDATTQECVNDMQCLPICENIRCGENMVDCCLPDQICLDGVVCAAQCEVDEVLCGTNLENCCFTGEICLNNICQYPGEDCENNFDCPDDTWYCETTIGACLPVPAGDICEGNPLFSNIEPSMEWYWPGITYNAKFYQNILASPVVGDINGDGIPDIAVVVYTGSAYQTDNLIVVLNGAGDGMGNGDVLFTIPGPQDTTASTPYGLASPALANFDSDRGLEIVYISTTGEVVIADNNGIGTVCDSTSFPGCTGIRPGIGAIWGGPSIADLNHDGVADIVVRCFGLDGRDISDSNKDLLSIAGCGENTLIADLNQDGTPEITDGDRAYSVGGNLLWDSTIANAGYNAVADIFPDRPGPEVVKINSNIYIVDGLDGTVLVGAGGDLISTDIAVPGGGFGGAPNIADFDGDGLVEISTAGQFYYTVFDPDCWDPPLRTGGTCTSNSTNFILWQTQTQDISSSKTGSSVFDFQGDGAAEVLYNDECFFHIYDGKTGDELVDPIIPSSSRTAAEYPLVADVDGDGNAEMIVISNQDQAISRDHCDVSWKTAGVSIDLLCTLTDCIDSGITCDATTNPCVNAGQQCANDGFCKTPGGTHGVRVYGDTNDRWVRTRTIWNQFHYYVTNIELISGIWTIPQYEQASWLSYNSYRQNVQGGVLFPVPDLTLEFTATEICPDEIRLVAVVKNDGSAGTNPGVLVNFYRTDTVPDELLNSVATQTTILPGGWERVVYVYTNPPEDITLTFSAVLDENDTIDECNNLNNEGSSQEIMCVSVE
jgi:predicted small lipoprotein YifL